MVCGSISEDQNIVTLSDGRVAVFVQEDWMNIVSCDKCIVLQCCSYMQSDKSNIQLCGFSDSKECSRKDKRQGNFYLFSDKKI